MVNITRCFDDLRLFKAVTGMTYAEFEALLTQIADEAEEWLTSAESLGITRPRTPVAVRRRTNGRTTPTRAREVEW